MERRLRVVFVLMLLALPLAIAASRPAHSIEVFAQPEGTQPPPVVIPIEGTPEPTPFPTATPVIGAHGILMIDIRRDLEVMADDQFGVGTRPEGWNVGVNQYDLQLTLLTRSDLELMASTLINPESRPRGWMSAFDSTEFAEARDVRYDLELLADLIYGVNNRPQGWVGGDPLLRCNRATQALVNLLERGGIFRLDVPANDTEFCRKAELQVTQFTETQILANAQLDTLFTDSFFILEPQQTGANAVAFLDTGATRRVGVIPRGIPIRIIARSYAQFSNMMLVSGPDFEVFVDYTTTTVTAEQFRRLPNVASLEINPNCFATWCGGTP